MAGIVCRVHEMLERWERAVPGCPFDRKDPPSRLVCAFTQLRAADSRLQPKPRPAGCGPGRRRWWRQGQLELLCEEVSVRVVRADGAIQRERTRCP